MSFIDRYTAQTIAPTAEPISLAQAKRQLRVDGTDDDTYINSLIATARSYVEYQCNTQLVVATFKQNWDYFPCTDEVCLNYSPLLSVSSITYVDTAGTIQTLSTDVYSVITHEKPGKIKLKYGQYWPSVRSQPDAVTVTFRAGYATPFTAVAATDVVTYSGSTPTDATAIRVTTTDADLPAGLSILTDYYPINSSGSTCKFSLTSGGAAVDITDTGTGTHFVGVIPEAATQAMLLLISFWYTTRNASMEAGFIPPQVGYLLSTINWGGQ